VRFLQHVQPPRMRITWAVLEAAKDVGDEMVSLPPSRSSALTALWDSVIWERLLVTAGLLRPRPFTLF
jgi:hypothetical protein